MLKIGIVGLPNVGKSTLFRALTKKQVDIANYPFVTIEPNIGIVEVPDNRIEELAAISRSKKKIHAVVEFVDIAGLVKGAAQGEGLGNQFLSHIREVDAIAEVVRVFEDQEIIHALERVNPIEDIAVIRVEIILKDLETVTKRIETLEKNIRGGEKTALVQKEILTLIQSGLGEGKTAQSVLEAHAKEIIGKKEVEIILKEIGLLTQKPFIFILNSSEKQIAKKWQPGAELLEAIGASPWILVSAKTEDELNTLEEKEKKEYLASLGVSESGLNNVIRTGYEVLNLITFFTTGEDETRGWTIPQGSNAPRAGRAIHSDFEEKFIRAEVISFEKLIEAGSYARARELGWTKTEGKDYEVKDGDVVEFKI